jgi:hypothetical protein
MDPEENEDLFNIVKGKKYDTIVRKLIKYMEGLSSGDDDDEVKEKWESIMNNNLII